jgi:hypothetical protein
MRISVRVMVAAITGILCSTALGSQFEWDYNGGLSISLQTGGAATMDYLSGSVVEAGQWYRIALVQDQIDNKSLYYVNGTVRVGSFFSLSGPSTNAGTLDLRANGVACSTSATNPSLVNEGTLGKRGWMGVTTCGVACINTGLSALATDSRGATGSTNVTVQIATYASVCSGSPLPPRTPSRSRCRPSGFVCGNLRRPIKASRPIQFSGLLSQCMGY